jgi:nucleoside-diphosphate kinase
MNEHIEKTLIIIKPEGVRRSIVGKIITRFEDAGFKIISMKMQWVDQNFAKQHYTEDISQRRGEHVREKLLRHLSEGPVIAMVLEGLHAIETIRKIVGGTEPKTAPPGTIRGDFANMSYAYADASDLSVRNIIHASSDKADAEREIKLWFNEKELHSYKNIHDLFL